MKFPQKVFVELLFFLFLNSSNVLNHFGGMYHCHFKNKYLYSFLNPIFEAFLNLFRPKFYLLLSALLHFLFSNLAWPGIRRL